MADESFDADSFWIFSLVGGLTDDASPMMMTTRAPFFHGRTDGEYLNE